LFDRSARFRLAEGENNAQNRAEPSHPASVKTIFCASLLALLSTAPHAFAQDKVVMPSRPVAGPLAADGLFSAEKPWTLDAAALEKSWGPKGFRWNSATNKDSGIIRRDRMGMGPSGITAFGGKRNIEEIVFTLKNNKLAEISIQIWNKGDAQNPIIPEATFKSMIEDWSSDLSGVIAPKFQDRGKDLSTAARAERRLWMGTETLAQLEFSASKVQRGMFGDQEGFQAEFIRLRLLPRSGGSAAIDASGQSRKRLADLRKGVVTEPGGDIVINDIPMVDQGEKGYCAVATASRVFQYLGVEVDMHEMAQISGNMAGGGGTNPQEMEEALRRIAIRYKARFQKLQDFDLTGRKYQSFQTKYNSMARKMKKPELDTKNYIYLLRGMDAEVLREVAGKGAPFEKFMTSVRNSIDRGVPVLWGLELGIYPENGQKARQIGGGHMRLITGYNPKTAEIIFSDSWGPGHEKKRMAAADASAATQAMFLITVGQ
jgi:Peptidase_C39 like family